MRYPPIRDFRMLVSNPSFIRWRTTCVHVLRYFAAIAVGNQFSPSARLGCGSAAEDCTNFLCCFSVLLHHSTIKGLVWVLISQRRSMLLSKFSGAIFKRDIALRIRLVGILVW